MDRGVLKPEIIADKVNLQGRGMTGTIGNAVSYQKFLYLET